jgi:hypothetical protein
MHCPFDKFVPVGHDCGAPTREYPHIPFIRDEPAGQLAALADALVAAVVADALDEVTKYTIIISGMIINTRNRAIKVRRAIISRRIYRSPK